MVAEESECRLSFVKSILKKKKELIIFTAIKISNPETNPIKAVLL